MSSNAFNISIARIRKFSYMLMAGSGTPSELMNYHDSAYRLWKASWNKTFASLKSEAVPRADDFLRPPIISALFDGQEAVGLLLHAHYNLDLEAAREHSYMSSFPAEIISRLRDEGYRNVLSMEYLTLGSKWRKAITGVHLAEVIVGLGTKIMQASSLSSVAVARVDRKVNEILYGFGAKPLISNLTNHNVPVDLVLFDKQNVHSGPIPEVTELVEHFWRHRKDTVGLGQIAAEMEKRAA